MKSAEEIIKHIDETISNMFKRPMMYASNIESFEFQIFQLLDVKHFVMESNIHLHKTWCKFYRKTLNVSGPFGIEHYLKELGKIPIGIDGYQDWSVFLQMLKEFIDTHNV